MTTSPAALVAAALANAGTPVDAATAERIAARLTPVTVGDAARAGRLAVMATQTLETFRTEPIPPVVLTRDERAKAFLREKGFDLTKVLGVKKRELWDAALHAVDQMDAGANTNEARAIVDVAAKHPSRITALDSLNVANARLADAGNHPVVGLPPVPSDNSTASLNPESKLRYSNRLSGETLRLYRDFSQISAKIATMAPGAGKMKATEYASNLARSLRIHGVSVEPPA
jgi:hypothetical protein